MANAGLLNGENAQSALPTNKIPRRPIRWPWLWWLLALLALSALLWVLIRGQRQPGPADLGQPPMQESVYGAWEGSLASGSDEKHVQLFFEGDIANFFVGCHTITATLGTDNVLRTPNVGPENPYGLCTPEIFSVEDYLVEFLSTTPQLIGYEDRITLVNNATQIEFYRPRPVN